MSTKNLYEEALADAKKVRELAIQDASQGVLDTLTPRIRKLVDSQILESSVEPPPRIDQNQEEDVILDQDSEFNDELDDVIKPVDTSTLDTETQTVNDINPLIAQIELRIENNKTFLPLLKAAKLGSSKDLELESYRLKEKINKLKSINSDLMSTKHYKAHLLKMIEGVADMYDYTQEVVGNSTLKSTLSEKLEDINVDLEQLQEEAMNKKTRRQLREADEELDIDISDDESSLETDETDETDASDSTTVSLNIDVPSELTDDLVDSLGEIEIEINDEAEGDSGEDDFDSDADADADVDIDVDSNDNTGSEEELDLQLNSRKLSDDTVIEIDENMLRRELRKMQENNYPTPSSDGYGVDDSALDDFGGGMDEGEPFSDIDVETEWPGARNPKALSTESLNALGDEEEDLTLSTEAEEETAAVKCEALKRRLRAEKNIQESIKFNSEKLRKIARQAKLTDNHKRYAMIEGKFKAEQRRYAKSINRTKKIKAQLAEVVAIGRSNSAPKSNLLRQKLAESNLNNVKLQLANKLLLQKNIPTDKRLKIVESLEAAKTIKEAKLLFNSQVKLVSEVKSPVRRGSASRATTSGNVTKSTLSEGFQTNRWGRLAGISGTK